MAGIYTRIEKIYGPAEAVAGSTVNIEVEVKNLFNGNNDIYVDGVVDGSYLDFGGYYLTVPAWQVVKFQDSFIMPSKNVTLKAISYYYGGGIWNKDDEFSVSIGAIVGAWISLATSSLSVKKAAIVGAWISLATGSLSVKKAIVGAWISLATSSLSVKKGITGGWVSLATMSLAVGVGIVTGQDIFKSLAVDFEKSLPKEFA